MAVAKSLLQAADIPFVVEGETIVDFFGAGRVGFNPVTGAPALVVAPEDEHDARAALAELLGGGGSGIAQDGE